MRQEQFEEFVRGNLPALGRYAYVLTGHREDAADLVQDSLVRLARAWPRVDEAGSPLAYAKTTMVRTHISTLRRLGRLRRSEFEDLPADDGFGSVDDGVDLRRALRTLSPVQRAVVVLSFFDDVDDVTIGHQLRRRPGAVRALRHRALRSLRAALHDNPNVEVRR
ncbi:RNA polymerase sigma factor, sigma-70 family [Asanoa hainanensis]|uniref:RNA polymerase sigma factor, sigma-70 family n=1 Tax=Asanoa hainanensis TaxID=560556 RepID=A0A239G325_9ACTN|nr:sigma-70 family RNA polymerase sigma factor [Asanoa hainanensis]SNS62972.1 RNA polymerase sigma factor, sigma-70 family [Asanoa hainanensis]